MSEQRRHESPELGAAVQRMMRALVTRAAEGDWEALEQLAIIEQLAPMATGLGAHLAHERMGYSFTQLADQLGVTRQAMRQRAARTKATMTLGLGLAHVLIPGHSKRTCATCSITELQAHTDGRIEVEQ